MTSTVVQPETTIRALADGLAAVEQAMLDITDSQVPVLRDASRHILNAGGKRVRPRLLLLAYLAAGGQDLHHAAKPAAAVELMHTASVVHDDINDHGVLRRGRPSINANWGRTFALLTGDFLFTAVYELMAPYQDLNSDLAQAATALVEGETLQASAVKENRFTREVYMQIIALKTAALFRAAATIGAKLAGAWPSQVDALATFGFQLGLAFQIADDILDLVADESRLGKNSGVDAEQGRGLAVALSKPQENGRKPSEDPMDAIMRKLLDGDTIEQARVQASQLVQNAITCLDTLDESAAKNQLIALAQMVIERES